MAGFFLKVLISKPEEIGHPRCIVILLWGGIGNDVLFSPVLYTIRKNFPQTHLTICSFHSFAKEMFFKTADSFITIGENPSLKSIEKLLFLLRRFHPDIVISNAMSPVFLSSLIAYLSGAKIRIGIERGHRGFLNNIRVYERKEHELIENIRIAKELLFNAESFPLAVDYTDFDEETAEIAFNSLHLKKDFPVVAIQPGSGKHQSFKRWDIDGFRKVAEKLLEHNIQVVVVGTEEEKNEIDYLEKILQSKNVRVLRRRLTLPQMVLFLKNFSLLIANDTSLVHLASIVKTPSVVIYGPTDPVKNHPWDVEYRIVRKTLPCSPCYNFRTPNCPYNFKCLHEITVEEVFNAAMELLSYS